jgi:hypothetical protein
MLKRHKSDRLAPCILADMSASVSGKSGPPIATPVPPSFAVKVQRHPHPPGRWRWMIINEATEVVVQKSQDAFRSAREAWEAGRRKLGKPVTGDF